MKDNNNKGRKRTERCICLVLILLLALCGCARKNDEPDASTDETPDVSAYLARIAELEAEVVALREQQYTNAQGNDSGNKNDAQSPADETAVFHYRVAEGHAFITGFEGNAAMVTVPEVLDGFPVTGIDDRAFEGASVATLSLPEGMESIGWFAFYGCANLVEICIPASVTAIGYAAFDGCTNIRIVCPGGSYASQYARSYGLNCTEK